MAFSLFGGGRRARLAVLAIFVTLVFLFMSRDQDVGWAPDLLPKEPPADRVAGGYRAGEAQKPEKDGYHDQDDKLQAAAPSAQPYGHADTGSATRKGSAAASVTSSPSTSASSDPTQEACVGFEMYQRGRPGPLSSGKREFPYVRPPAHCRTFRLDAMEGLIAKMKRLIKDPDLFRLFENSYPNTLDTMIKWRGFARTTDPITGQEKQTDQELTYVITGDIDAMWLRDSASQIYSYLPLLEPSTSHDSLASLWRGLINSHSRYIIISPYCHSFQPPPESGIPPTHNGAYSNNNPMPRYDPQKVFDCKWELDSLASFLQISSAYYQKTGDLEFFAKYNWTDAVAAAVHAAKAMVLGTYDSTGRVQPSAWTFTGWTNRGSETLTNDGLGNPVKENGMVRTAFRPSDDACIFQLLTPANMMWAKYLEEASHIMEKLDGVPAAADLTLEMRQHAFNIRTGIDRDAIVPHARFGDIFAYEVDGFGGANTMDDANIPSLLAMPLWNFTRSEFKLPAQQQTEGGKDEDAADDDEDNVTSKKSRKHDYKEIYQNTRKFILSDANPYYAKGPFLSAVGGPHLGPGKGWPMAAIIAAMTAYDPLSGSKNATADVAHQLGMVLNSTGGTGVIHESVNAWSVDDWTRAWFGWANGLFGELIIRIAEHEDQAGMTGTSESLLGRSWQY